jgi:hypothetical protein
MPIYRGSNTKLDYTGIKMTDALRRALEILDSECSYGTFDISATDPEEGLPKEYRWSATPCDGPYETLYFNGGSWVDCSGLPNDEEDEEVDDDEECACSQCAGSSDDNANSKEA